MTDVYIGLGSNLGDRVAHIEQAIGFLDELADTHVVSSSSLYETEPRFVRDQPYFLNACVNIETTLAPRNLLDELLAIESAMGRVRNEPNGPRTIDLDILLYGEAVIDEPGLQIPHPGLPSRAFVLVPLAEIAPDIAHPEIDSTIVVLRDRCIDTASVHRVATDDERLEIDS